jgi:hypothetical protein
MTPMRPLSSSLLLLALGCAASAPRSAAPDAVPFIEDDYPRALALAKERHVPLFVDGWAPW